MIAISIGLSAAWVRLAKARFSLFFAVLAGSYQRAMGRLPQKSWIATDPPAKKQQNARCSAAVSRCFRTKEQRHPETRINLIAIYPAITRIMPIEDTASLELCQFITYILLTDIARRANGPR